MPHNRTCSNCNEAFILKPDKPGNINHCPDCSFEPFERLGGNMTWHHKTAPELQIRPLSQAQYLAKQQKRVGTGVTQCLVERKSL